MIEMARRFLRQKAGSLSTVLALCLLAVMACLPLNSGQGFGSVDTIAVLVLGAGCVSRDASSGALQMILARPIRRTDYLAGRYLGVLAAAAVFLGGTIVLAATLDTLIGSLSVGAGAHAFSFAAAARAAGHAFFGAALLAAALLFFSTFLRGWGDVLAVVLGYVLFQTMQGLGSLLKQPLLSGAGSLAMRNLAPSVPWDTVLKGQDVFGEPTGRYLLALVLYATLAATVFSRRELSYGQD